MSNYIYVDRNIEIEICYFDDEVVRFYYENKLYDFAYFGDKEKEIKLGKQIVKATFYEKNKDIIEYDFCGEHKKLLRFISYE